jgi:hypothetical protein
MKKITQKSMFFLLFNFVAFIAAAQTPTLRFTEANNNFVQWTESATLVETNPDFTIEMWVKAPVIAAGFTRMLYCEGLDSNLTMFRLYGSGGKVIVRPNGVSGVEQMIGVSTVFDDTWHHIAVVGTTPGGLGALTTLKLYIDGVLEITNTYTRNTANYDRSVLGNLTRTASQLSATAFDGEIDEFRLWSRALSASEIAANKCSPASTTNLFRHVRFNEGSGTTVYDQVSAASTAISGASPIWGANASCPALAVHSFDKSNSVLVSAELTNTGYLNINNQSGSDLTFTIFDSSGRNIKDGKVEAIIDLRNPSKGLYILRIKNKSTGEVLLNKKILKQ